MEKFIEQIKTNKWIHYGIIIVIGLILSIPIFKISIIESHDGYLHLKRLFGTVNTFKIGQFPPIVAPYFCKGGRICYEFVL